MDNYAINSNVNPIDINRIQNFLNCKIASIEQIETENYIIRVYNVNKDRIITINNYTQECNELMG